MNKIQRKKSIIISISFTESYIKILKKLAQELDISMSDVLRQSLNLFKEQRDRIKYGRYGGIQLGQAKMTKLMREEQRTETIKMLQDAAPMEVIDYLVEIKYLDPDRVENTTLFCYRIRDEAAGRMLYQLQINQTNGEEIYSRSLLNFDELIKDLVKNKKI